MTDKTKKSERRMKKVSIAEVLLEQAMTYSGLFPRTIWTIQARVNYLVQVGLAVLLAMFYRDAEERQKVPQFAGETLEFKDQLFILGIMDIVRDRKLPGSEVFRLLMNSGYK